MQYLIKIRLQQAPINRIKINLINTANFTGRRKYQFFLFLSPSLTHWKWSRISIQQRKSKKESGNSVQLSITDWNKAAAAEKRSFEPPSGIVDTIISSDTKRTWYLIL
jgi:hypothetical protein